ncbi:MAG: hypothetical protein M3R40_06285 [Pseudomonadota bacterium]|nr:hypothetical protein [Pseudomonadota bacterium]
MYQSRFDSAASLEIEEFIRWSTAPFQHANDQHQRRIIMGKYALAWLLGVPGIVLVVVYLLMH